MILLVLAAFQSTLAEPAADMSAAVPETSIAAAAPSAAAPPAKKVCRTRFRAGQGLIGSTRQYKVCKTEAEWKASSASPE